MSKGSTKELKPENYGQPHSEPDPKPIFRKARCPQMNTMKIKL
jgi:hypothetical protein